jgi:hypothetical protein
MSKNYVFIVPFSPVHLNSSHLSNACQFQAGTIFDVIFEWFGGVIAKIYLERRRKPYCDCREKAFQRGTDWNFPTCKFRCIGRWAKLWLMLKLI